MSSKADVVVIGAGHNGLTCAAYLARSGLNTLVLERRDRVGGVCTEYEFMPGFKASMPNSPGSLEPKVVRDLDLKQYGLEFRSPDPSLVVPFPGGRALVAWRDPQKTAEEIRKFSENDVNSYREFFSYLNDFALRLGVSLFDPPPTIKALAQKLRTPEDEHTFSKVVLGSLKDLLDEWFESEELKSVIGAISATSNLVGPYTPGTAYMLLMRPLSLASSSVVEVHDPRKQYLRGSTGLPVGGMGAITRAMQKSIEAAGGSIRVGVGVKQIIAGMNGIEGVELENGEMIAATRVVSNLHPRTTLIDLLADPVQDPAFVQQVQQLPRRGSAFKLALALDGVPSFEAAPKGYETVYASCQFRLAPSLDYMERAYDDAKYRRPSEEPVILGLIPSLTSPGMAPPGKHIMSCNVWHAPVELDQGSWDEEREKMALRCIEIIGRSMPDLEDRIIDYRALSPVDLENEFGLRDANIMHLEMMPSQMFGLRPLASCAAYKTSTRGLYLCGSGTWPGGTVSGIPGHNAAQVILQDFKASHEGN